MSDAEAAFTADGELIGLRVKTIFDLGAHLLSLSIVPPLSYSIHVLGPYRIANAGILNVGVYTNTAPTDPSGSKERGQKSGSHRAGRL